MDNRPEVAYSGQPAVDIGAYFESFSGTPSTIAGSWPRFRGAHYDNISRDETPLAREWSAGGPPLLWSVDLGEGHAGPVVYQGRVYVLDHDGERRADVLRCFSLEDGQELWRRGYGIYIKRNHGISRTVPAVSGNRVVTIGPKGHVMCVDADSGDLRWGVDLAAEYGAEVPLWYTGQCPLIDDEVAVIAVGGESLMVGADLDTGEVLWRTPNPRKWKMSHSSVVPFSILGTRMYVYCAIGGVVGISAEPGSAGAVLFESALWDRNVIAPSPVYLGDGKLLLTAGYGGGSMVVEVLRKGATFVVESRQEYKPGEGLASEQQTPILLDGHLFAVMPKDAGPLRNQLVCVDPADCSKIVWSSGTDRFGLGPYLVADGKLFLLRDDGTLVLLEASAQAYRPLARAKVLHGHDAWGPMALVQGRLLARDSRRMACLDVSAP